MEDKYSGSSADLASWIGNVRFLKAKTIPGGVQDPGVVVGALHTSVQSQSLSRQLPGGKGAGVGEATERLALHSTFGLPLLEVPQGDRASGVLHPLDHLKLRDEVSVIVSSED